MKLVPPGSTRAPEAGLFNDAERKRMRWMAFAFVLAISTFFIFMQKENARRAEEAALEAERQELISPTTVVVTPEINRAALEALVRDGMPAERVQIETAALARALRDTTLVNDSLYGPMGGERLDAERAAVLVGADDAARSAARGQLLRAYGWVEALDERGASDDLPAHLRGRLRQEDGSLVAFVAQHGPDRLVLEGDFLRVDGIFLKAVRAEGPKGWVEAPLLVGPRARVAYALMDAPSEIDPAAFAFVEDDSLANGISGPPFEAYWELVAWVRDMDPNAVDWAAAPLLNREGMTALALDPAAFRARPVRLPISQIMDSYVLAQPENPLRIERMSEGWIGHEDWFGPINGVVKFVSPRMYSGVKRRDLVVARGYFLKQLAYETSKAGIGVAPFFVLQDIELVEPGSDKGWQKILMTFGGTFLFLAGLLVFMLRRDRNKSAQLQIELLQRRRARREAARAPSS